ncbi:exodeoxyribonuclease III [Tessaracoccus oleiagri]|uniref:Exodeoxyribonuclease-3 n=1 Tax=Tessaracoccus oleiagri TaxID=686624 RepID=A0A1G9KPC6_9ACTN|nr:exodeoxyribonuclease III [Tessaracoccus oleiagri]SDL51337.1 exodeoxyribonuclease-3 [Tessaracoccus oleiagri]
MRIGTHNVNGIRATLVRGFRDFWDGAAADVIAVQEVRCRAGDLPLWGFDGWHATLELGHLPGRNGVAVLTKAPPVAVRTLHGGALHRVADGRVEEISSSGVGGRDLRPFATEGRYVEVDLADAPLRVASLYLPKGAAWPYDGLGEEKYRRKMRFLRGLRRQLRESRLDAQAQGREFLVMGDFNIAHQQLDLKNWRGNQRSEGFLPEEREWFSSILGPRTLVDVVRRHTGDVSGPYSWWSWRGQSFTGDIGWRIDYHLASPGLARSATSTWTAREPQYEHRMSDHCPVIVDYAI